MQSNAAGIGRPIENFYTPRNCGVDGMSISTKFKRNFRYNEDVSPSEFSSLTKSPLANRSHRNTNNGMN